MRVVAVALNIVLFGFTCVVVLVDGPPQAVAYIVFTMWLLLTLTFSALVISRLAFANNVARVAAVACNIVSLGFTCWAFLDQYPHPEEEGFIAFMVLIVLTPIMNLAALLRGGAGDGWLTVPMRRKAL